MMATNKLTNASPRKTSRAFAHVAIVAGLLAVINVLAATDAQAQFTPMQSAIDLLESQLQDRTLTTELTTVTRSADYRTVDARATVELSFTNVQYNRLPNFISYTTRFVVRMIAIDPSVALRDVEFVFEDRCQLSGNGFQIGWRVAGVCTQISGERPINFPWPEYRSVEIEGLDHSANDAGIVIIERGLAPWRQHFTVQSPDPQQVGNLIAPEICTENLRTRLFTIRSDTGDRVVLSTEVSTFAVDPISTQVTPLSSTSFEMMEPVTAP